MGHRFNKRGCRMKCFRVNPWEGLALGIWVDVLIRDRQGPLLEIRVRDLEGSERPVLAFLSSTAEVLFVPDDDGTALLVSGCEGEGVLLLVELQTIAPDRISAIMPVCEESPALAGVDSIVNGRRLYEVFCLLEGEVLEGLGWRVEIEPGEEPVFYRAGKVQKGSEEKILGPVR